MLYFSKISIIYSKDQLLKLYRLTLQKFFQDSINEYYIYIYKKLSTFVAQAKSVRLKMLYLSKIAINLVKRPTFKTFSSYAAKIRQRFFPSPNINLYTKSNGHLLVRLFADCLHLQLYADSKDRYKQGQTKASLSLQHFLGVQSGFTLDKESNTIAIICQDVTVVLAFDTRERLIQWQVKISNNLGDGTCT